MKKILFFTSSHKIGLTDQLTEQAIAFTKSHSCEFLFISGEKEQFPCLFDKLKAHAVNHKVIYGIDDHSEFLRLIREFRYISDQFQADFVTVQTNWQLAIAAIAKYFCRKKFAIVYFINGYRHNHRIRSCAARFLMSLALYLFAQQVITPSSFVAQHFSFLRRKNITIAIGQNNLFFQDYPPPSFPGVKRFVFAGDFRAGKNQDALIKSFKRYRDISGDEHFELYLPGKGKYLDYCKNLSRVLSMENNIFFPGFLDRTQMADLYLRCQFSVVPSNAETYGHCIVEPFTLGRVVISRHVGIADDIIIHGITGFLFESEDDLLNILLSVISDEVLCQTVARNAFNQRDQFRWDVVCKQYVDLIYNV